MLSKLCKTLGISGDELLGVESKGKGSRARSSSSVRRNSIITLEEFEQRDHDDPREAHSVLVPFYESIPAGGFSSVDPEEAGLYPVLHHLVHEGVAVIRVHGDSMYDRIWDKDLVLIDKTQTSPKPGQIVAAVYEGEYTLKRFFLSHGHPTLWADNQDFVPRLIEIENPKELSILGTVTRIIDRQVR
jgi:repressor LexA